MIAIELLEIAAETCQNPRVTLAPHRGGHDMENRSRYQFGEFVIDLHEGGLWRQDEPVPLTPKAFNVLAALVEQPGRLVSKDELLQKVWPGTFVEESNLAYNVFALRKALGDTAGSSRYIETVPKRGYRFTAPVTVVAHRNSRDKDSVMAPQLAPAVASHDTDSAVESGASPSFWPRHASRCRRGARAFPGLCRSAVGARATHHRAGSGLSAHVADRICARAVALARRQLRGLRLEWPAAGQP